MNNHLCPVCFQQFSDSYELGSFNEIVSVNCEQCGLFGLTEEAKDELYIEEERFDSFGRRGSRRRANLSTWLIKNQKNTLSTADLNRLKELRNISFQERVNNFLLELNKRTNFAGEQILVKSRDWLAYTNAINFDELTEILDYLFELEYIYYAGNEPTRQLLDVRGLQIKICPNGWEYLEELRAINSESNQIFIAMWFDDQMKEAYTDGFEKGIEDAGYNPFRVDKK